MNNSFYGKTLERVRAHRDVQFVQTRRQLRKWVSKSTFKQYRVFTPNLLGVQVVKSKVLMNRPTYVGFVILELSKWLMYDFHYNFIKKKYVGVNNAQLLYTDTDSLPGV